ncbi:hypothetical protein [Anaeromyxobacter oryzae]|uniref:Uncharacterized protein n=1 Tax=Anaeromyxobacter oryzae TaxID=2918170 RepID=A0ABM7X2I3_9BACT|nr:hypothetical protein [Anaeromyxobacter oryzae]BDG05992.1 hypothetical protein AMOR_49880 [Anaeromyxobacter oryzae]
MSAPVAPNPHARALLSGALATLGLTAAHHAYGAVRYATPWRLHGAIVALGIGLVMAGVSSVYRRHLDTPLGRLAGWALAIMVLVFPVLVIGLFESLYNHVAKDVLFFSGAPRDLLARMFPPPTYEMPNDAWFELTGVLQVVPAALACGALLRFVRALRAAGRMVRPLRAGATG